MSRGGTSPRACRSDATTAQHAGLQLFNAMPPRKKTSSRCSPETTSGSSRTPERSAPSNAAVYFKTASNAFDGAIEPKTPFCIVTILSAARWLPWSVAPQQSSSKHS